MGIFCLFLPLYTLSKKKVSWNYEPKNRENENRNFFEKDKQFPPTSNSNSKSASMCFLHVQKTYDTLKALPTQFKRNLHISKKKTITFVNLSWDYFFYWYHVEFPYPLGLCGWIGFKSAHLKPSEKSPKLW